MEDEDAIGAHSQEIEESVPQKKRKKRKPAKVKARPKVALGSGSPIPDKCGSTVQPELSKPALDIVVVAAGDDTEIIHSGMKGPGRGQYAASDERSNPESHLVSYEQFHNANFQPDAWLVVSDFFLCATQPIYFLIAWLPKCYSVIGAWWHEEIAREDGLRELRCHRRSFDWMLDGISVPSMVSFNLLAWFLAGHARDQVSVTEALQPFCFFAALCLTNAAAFHVKLPEAVEIDQFRAVDCISRLRMHDEAKSKFQELASCYSSLGARSRLVKELRLQSDKLVRRQDPSVFREAFSLCCLQLKMKLALHESLLRHLSRMREQCDCWVLDEKIKSEPRPAFWGNFTSAYRKCFDGGNMPLEILAQQSLLGLPHKEGMLDTLAVGVSWLQFLAALCLATFAALVPNFIRNLDLSFGLPKHGWCQVVSILFMIYTFRFGMLLLYRRPARMMSPLTEMVGTCKILQTMLMGPTAAVAQGIPYVRVGSLKDIGAWYELYSFFIASTQRRKFTAEVALAANLVIVLTMSGLLVWHTTDPDWTPGVLFFETLVVLISFILFSVPPLFMGLRANLLRQRTVDLLWGHVTESRAYLSCIQNKSEQCFGTEEIRDAIGLTESIAQRLRLDAALVLRVVGIELTVAQFTAIASVMSTAAALILRYVDWQRIVESVTISGN